MARAPHFTKLRNGTLAIESNYAAVGRGNRLHNWRLWRWFLWRGTARWGRRANTPPFFDTYFYIPVFTKALGRSAGGFCWPTFEREWALS